MEKPRISSREYKVMLRAEQFRGDEEALLRMTRKFWQEFSRAINPVVINPRGDLDNVEKERFILFYDTADRRLYKNGYILRERSCELPGDREVTLKFRHPDVYLTQDRDMTGRCAGGGKTKFEEDIKPPFQTLYSFSTNVKISANKKLNRMNDPARLYPGLAKKLDRYDKAEIIRPVGNLTSKELVVTGAAFHVSKRPKVEAKCGLIVWHQAASNSLTPAVVEFSFRYGDDSGNYSGDCAKRAYDAFLMLQSKKLSNWVDAASRTKTAYVYSLDQDRMKQ